MNIDDIRRASAQRQRPVPGVGSANARKRLEAALCALVDYESEIKEAMALSGSGESYSRLCDALSNLADDDG